MPRTGTAVLLFARAPALEGKDTGLPHRTQLELFRSMLNHTARVLRSARAPFDLVVAHDGPLEPCLDPALAFPQRGATFGERLLHAVHTARGHGYERLVLIGTDTPQLSGRDIDEAVMADEQTALVGPSVDGGFYLLSIPAAAGDALLSRLPWRTPAVLGALLEAIRRSELTPRMLKARRDVDLAADVAALRALLDQLCLHFTGVRLGSAPVPALPLAVRSSGLDWVTNNTAQGPPAVLR